MDIPNLKNNDKILLKNGIKKGKIHVHSEYGSMSIMITDDMAKLSNTVVTVSINTLREHLFCLMSGSLIIKTDDNHYYIIPRSFVKKKVTKCKYKVGQKVLIKVSKTSGYTFDDKDRVVPAVIMRMYDDRFLFKVKGYEHDGVINEVMKNNSLVGELSSDWIYSNKETTIVKVIKNGDNNANKK